LPVPPVLRYSAASLRAIASRADPLVPLALASSIPFRTGDEMDVEGERGRMGHEMEMRCG
jgi:hypothetical protein